MSTENRGVLIDIERLEELLPGKRILDQQDLNQMRSFLYRLWEHAYREKIPEDFKTKIFVLSEYFNYYVAGSPGPYRPTKFEEVERITKLLPPVH